jgi:2-polyprenyl-3-methyl-5-hydroxy-6-metoxy-1,4-benzoquinol methylase
MHFDQFSNTEQEFRLFLEHTNEKQVAAETIFRRLSRTKSLSSTHRIWDVGCGSGDIVSALVKMIGREAELEITLLEPESQLLEMARKKLRQSGVFSIVGIPKTVEAAVEGDDYRQGFDLIISSQVLNYVIDAEATLCQLYRALAPEGQFCASLLTPTSDIFLIRSMYLQHFGHLSEVGIHSEQLLEVIGNLGWRYDTEVVLSYVELSLSDVEELIENPQNLDVLRNNVAARITRFIGNSPLLTIPLDLLTRIVEIYRKRVRSGKVYLESKERFVWVDK